MTSAARRASRASSRVQQPRAPVRNDFGLLDSARCTPVTSCPASAARAAATAESTPPDIAARTLIGCRRCPAFRARSTTGPITSSTRVDVGGRRGVPEGEPQRAAGQRLRDTHREQHVARLRRRRQSRPSRSSTRSPRASSSSSSESPSQPGNEKCALPGRRCVGREVGVTVEHRVRHGDAQPGDEVVAQRRRPARPLRAALDGELGGGGESGDRGSVERAGADVALLAAAMQHAGSARPSDRARAHRLRAGRRSCAR